MELQGIPADLPLCAVHHCAVEQADCHGGEVESLCGVGGGACPVTLVECANPDLPPVPGVCSVTPGDGRLLLEGTVLGPEVIYRRGQVLVNETGGLACVGCDCGAGLQGYTRVVCPGGVISPGLLNPHEHLTYAQHAPSQVDQRCGHRHDWRLGRNGCVRDSPDGDASSLQITWGELRHLLGGTTSIAGAGGAPGFVRNLDQPARDEGIGADVELSTFPLDDSNGTTCTEGCAYPKIDDPVDRLAHQAYVPHVAEGITRAAQNEFACLSCRRQEGAFDLTSPRSAFIHAVALDALQYQQMAHEGVILIWSPRSNLALYGDTARVATFRAFGGMLALGTDWIPTGSMNPLRELACARYLSQVHYDGFFSDHDLWQMVTVHAALALGVGERLGTLAPGFAADLVVFDGRVRPAYRAIVEAGVRDVRLVLRSGQPLYGDAELVAGLPGGGACEELPGGVCLEPRRLCLSRELPGTDWAELSGTNSQSYGLFFCDLPEREPTCQPSRGLPPYGPVPIPEVDADGDGVPDGEDNCPRVFNPPRPLDNPAELPLAEWQQADLDDDGVGDDCDPCPTEAGVEACTGVDTDQDAIPEELDNCPCAFNDDQQDRDQDGLGDACDPCHADRDPATSVCDATLYDLKNGNVWPGEWVRLTRVLVSAVADRGFFLQVAPDEAEYQGADHSGIYVYHPGQVGLLPGQRIDLEGRLLRYHGQLQITEVPAQRVVIVEESPEPLPAPVLVPCADVIDGAPRAATLEGVLIRLEGEQRVSQLVPPAGRGDPAPTNEFELDCGLRVNDLLYLVNPFPALGDRIQHTTGILHWANDHYKLEPRSAQDLPFRPVLRPFTPARTTALIGEEPALTQPMPLTLHLSRPAIEEVEVVLTSSAPDQLQVTSLRLAAGMTEVPVPVRGLVASPEPVEVVATLDEVEVRALVEVIAPRPPMLVGLRPEALTLSPLEIAMVEVQLDLLAGEAGEQVVLSIEPPGLADALRLPEGGLVLVEPGQYRASFPIEAGEQAASVVLWATLGAVTLGTPIEILAEPLIPPTLLINEVDYDNPGNDTAEFIELFNPSESPLPLAGIQVQLINGANTPSPTYTVINLANQGRAAVPGHGYVLIHGVLLYGAQNPAPATCALAFPFPPGTSTCKAPDHKDCIQNGGPDALAVVNLATGQLLDALSYEGCVTRAMLTGIAGETSICEGVGVATARADTNDDPNPGSLGRFPSGADTGHNELDFRMSSLLTPCAENREP